MKTKLQRWGNSQGIRVPKVLLDEIGLAVGSEVELQVSRDGRSISMRPMRPMRGRYRIEELVAGVTPESSPGEVDWGTPQGEEEW